MNSEVTVDEVKAFLLATFPQLRKLYVGGSQSLGFLVRYTHNAPHAPDKEVVRLQLRQKFGDQVFRLPVVYSKEFPRAFITEQVPGTGIVVSTYFSGTPTPMAVMAFCAAANRLKAQYAASWEFVLWVTA